MPLKAGSTVHPLDFSNLSGKEFERLVFATLLRMFAWRTLDWFGQVGADGGRDIIGTRDDDFGNIETVVVACANWKSFTSGKGISDIDKILVGAKPSEILIVTGKAVSAATKKKCVDHATAKGIPEARVWSGPEFEEYLRFHAASVLQRFFSGETLPDEAKALMAYVQKLAPGTEREAGELIARLFKRPAFTTRIQEESNLPAFRRAIGDTIGALNTGIWRDREGAIISRIPSLHAFPSSVVKVALGKGVEGLTALRTTFDKGLRTKSVRPCGCGKPDCPTFMIKPEACDELEAKRSLVLRHINTALGELGVSDLPSN